MVDLYYPPTKFTRCPQLLPTRCGEEAGSTNKSPGNNNSGINWESKRPRLKIDPGFFGDENNMKLNYVNHTYPKPEIRPKNCQNFLFPNHLEELANFRTH